LATAYSTLANDLDSVARQLDTIVTDLAVRWRGHGATALHVPAEVIGGDLRTLAAGCRSAAQNLEDYAEALHKAQHHHGWSLTKIIAVGAIVAVTAVAVVVTVGAAAPVGTLAAAEVGEAIAGAEAAAGAATAAETAATTALSLTGQTMTGLRGLTMALLPHLTNGAISTGIDTTLHLVTGHKITGTDLAESFGAGFLGSATTTATRTALHSTEAFRGATTIGKAALDTTALTATLGTDDALSQYATTGHLNPTRLTENALLTAFTGGLSTLRNPVTDATEVGGGPGRSVVPVKAPQGQTLAEIINNDVDLSLHEGLHPLGHTLANHVGQTVDQLKARLKVDAGASSASSFPDVATAEAAITQLLAAKAADVAWVAAAPGRYRQLRFDVGQVVGTVARRDDTVVQSSIVCVKIVNVGGKLVIRTAFVGNPGKNK
jgi:Bacterial CdiA-CT RNAse A domain